MGYEQDDQPPFSKTQTLTHTDGGNNSPRAGGQNEKFIYQEDSEKLQVPVMGNTSVQMTIKSPQISKSSSKRKMGLTSVMSTSRSRAKLRKHSHNQGSKAFLQSTLQTHEAYKPPIASTSRNRGGEKLRKKKRSSLELPEIIKRGPINFPSNNGSPKRT